MIRDITMQVWPQTYVPIIGEEQVAYMLGRFYSPQALEQQMTRDGHRFLIGYRDDEAVAFASWSEIEPGVCKLHKLYTAVSAQGTGVGRAMVDRVVKDAGVHGASSLRLNVNIHNHAAMAFYHKYGFVRIYDEDIDIGRGFFMNDHVYAINLTTEK